MAKQINTRIMLKHDSLTNWNESSLVLKPGEVGVAYVDVATKDTKGNIIHVPTALLKVGENVENSTKTFKELPFVSAIAADVYGWAKKEGIEITTVGEGECIGGIEWKDDKLVITRIDVVTPSELSTALASYYTKEEINTLIAGYYTKTEIDGKIETINGVNSGLASRVESLETTRSGHGNIVTRNVAEFATAEQGAKADAAAPKTYVDEELAKYTKTADLPTDLGDFTNNAGYAKTTEVTSLIGEVAIEGVDDTLTVIDYVNEMDARTLQEIEGVLEDVSINISQMIGLDKLEEGQSVVDYIDTANAALQDALQESIEAVDARIGEFPGFVPKEGEEPVVPETVVDYVNLYVGMEVNSLLEGLGETNTKVEDLEIIAANNADLIGQEKMRAITVEENLQTQINTIMNNPDTEGVINSINEFTQYIADHGAIADGFRTDIDKNKEDIAANTQAISEAVANAEQAMNTASAAQGDAGDALSQAAAAVSTANDALEAATNATNSAYSSRCL